MTPFQTREKLRRYRFRPQNFSQAEAKELEKYAKMYGIPHSSEATELPEAGVSGVLSQFSSGLTEGFLGPLAMGGWAEDPQDEIQSIAHSAGHLLGFAVPLAGSVLTGGGSLIARAGLGGIGRGVQTAGTFLKTQKSVPLRVADFAEDKAKDFMAKAGWEAGKYLQSAGKAVTTKQKLTDVAFQGAHLGVASTVSGMWDGEDNELDNFMFGAVAGGFFGGLGNFVRIGNMIQHPNPKVVSAGKKSLWEHSKELSDTLYNYRGQIVRGALGAGFQGGMATMQGAPTATQFYEYALGAFFGKGAHGVPEKMATKFFNRFNEKQEDGVTLKYEFSDMRKMLESTEYLEMPKETQEIIRDKYNNHIGEIWDRATNPDRIESGDSTASVVLGSELSGSYNKALERKAKDLAKKVKDLEPHEIAETQAELIDVIPTKYRRQGYMGVVTEGIMRKVNKGEQLEGQAKEIVDSMSPEAVKELKSGVADPLERAITEYYEKLPTEKLKLTAEDLLITDEMVASDQPETSSIPLLRRSFNRLQKDVPSDINEADVLTHAIKYFNTLKETGYKDKAVKEIVEDYMTALEAEFPTIKPDVKTKGAFIQAFTRLKQGKTRPILSFNKVEKKSGFVESLNILKRKVTGAEAKSADEVMYEKLWGNKIQVREFNEVVDRAGNSFFIAKPHDRIWNPTSKKWEGIMDKQGWMEVMGQLEEGGFYLKIPKKDTGAERIYPHHPKTSNTTVDTILKKVQKKGKVPLKVLNEYVEKDYRLWLKTMGMTPKEGKEQNLRGLYNKAFKSNFLYEENFGFKTAIARVKREALLSSKGFFQSDPEIFKDIAPDGKVKIHIVDTESNLKATDKIRKWFNVSGKEPEMFWTKNAKGEYVEEAWTSKIDGWVVMHSDLFNRFVEANGFKGHETSHLKPAVAIRMPDGSLFLVKGGVHASRMGYNEALKDPNSMIIATSAVKALPPGIKTYLGQSSKKGKYSLYDKEIFDATGKKVKATTPSMEMKVDDFRISFGVYGDSHSGKPVSIKKQMHTFFEGLTMSRSGYKDFMDAIHQDVVHGTPRANEYMDALVRDPKTAMPKNFDVTELSDKHFVQVINDITHPLHRELNKEIFKKLKEMEATEEFEAPVLQELKEYANSFEQWYRRSGYHPASSIINYNLYSRTVHMYRMDKFTNPVWKNSGSGWVAGVDPIMEAVTGGIRENKSYDFYQDGEIINKEVGHFKLGHSHGKMKIKWFGKEVDLYDAYNEYLEGKGTPERMAQMRQQLMMAVMRVPANAISGTRALLFDGFVDNDVVKSKSVDGKKVKYQDDWSVYMRSRDHFYIDGADVDGDKVFFFQGMPHTYMNDLIKNDTFFERLQDKKQVLFENKAKKFDKLFKSETSKDDINFVENNPIAQWSPGQLRKAGMSARTGKKGLGIVVNTKSFLNTVLSDIITNKKGKLELDVHYRGKFAGTLIGKTDIDHLKSDMGYYVVGTEAHSRTADSANYYSMATPQEMAQIIFESAFKKIVFKTKDGKFRPARLSDLKNTLQYRHLIDLNAKLYGYNYEKGRAYNQQEVNEAIQSFKTEPQGMSSIEQIAHNMAQHSLDVNPLKHFNYKSMSESIRLLNNTIFKEDGVLGYITRKNLRVLPVYYHVDYNAVRKAMANHPEFRTTEGERLRKVDDKMPTKAQRKPYRDFIFEAMSKPNEEGLTLLEQRYAKMGKLAEGKKIQKTFNSIFTNERAFEGRSEKPISRLPAHIEKEYRINDTYDVWSALQLMSKGRRLEKAIEQTGEDALKGGNVPYDDINRIANEIYAGRELSGNIDVLKNEKWSVQIEKAVEDLNNGKIPRSRPENKFTILRDIISRHAEGIKLRFNHAYKNSKEPAFRTEAEMNQRILKDKKEIAGYAKELGIRPEIAVEYYENYLLGSIRPQQTTREGYTRNINARITSAKKRKDWSKVEELRDQKENWLRTYENTSTPKFMWTMDAINSKTMEEFMTGYGNTFDLLNAKNPEKLPTSQEKLYDYLSKQKNDIKLGNVESKSEALEVHDVEIDRVFRLNQAGDVEITKDIKDIDKVNVPKDIPGTIKQIKETLKDLPDGATLRFEDLYTVMKNMQQSPTTSIKEATWDDIRNFNRFLKDIKDQSSNAHKWWYSFIFPDAIGRKMAGHDLDLLYKMQIPVKNEKDSGLATIKVPVSTMSFINKTGGNIREIEDAIKNSMVEELFTSIGVKAELEAIPNGITKFTDLFMFAQKKMNFERTSHQERKEFYFKELQQTEDYYKAKYEGKTHKITRNGKQVEVTSEQLIDDIINQQSQYFERFFERFIGTGIVDKDGAWNRVDWSRIDEGQEWAGTGLKIHDLIKYNKYGRFDIQGFNQQVMSNVETFGVNKLYKLIGKTTNPLGVELLNRVQYETALEEYIIRKGIKNPDSDKAMRIRTAWRKADKTKFYGVGRVGGKDTSGEFITEYFPQMMHDKKKLKSWMQNESVQLKTSLENYITELTNDGKLINQGAYNINKNYRLNKTEIDALTGKIPTKKILQIFGVTGPKKLRERIVNLKLERQRQDFEIWMGSRVEDATGQSDYLVQYLNAEYKKGRETWQDINAEHRPGTGRSRSEVPMPHFSYGFEVLEAYTNQWVGSFFKNLNALAFRKAINQYAENNVFAQDNPEVAEMWVMEMRKYASSLMGKSNFLPSKYTGLTKVEQFKLKEKLKTAKGLDKKRIQAKLRSDDRLKRKFNVRAPWYNPLQSFEYKMSDQNIVDYLDAKSQGLDRWLLPNKLHGTSKDPKLFGMELPTGERARHQVLFQTLNNIGAFESKMSLITLLSHPKTSLGNILGGSSNTVTNMGLRNFVRARDTKYLIQNVFAGGKLKDGTPIRTRADIHRWVAEIGALESFYIDEAMQDRRLDAKKLKPFIKEVFSKERVNDATIKDLMNKYQVTDSIMSAGGYFMRTSERALRTDAFLAHYLNAREYLSRIIPNMPFDHPYLTGMALKGVEATQFLYHNLNRPSISRSAMGKVMTRFQPFVWNSLRFRRDIYKQQKMYNFADKTMNDRAKRLMTLDLMTMALANVFVGSIFDSILPPPMNYLQDTAEWLFGDERSSERAFFSSYPSTALAPLQVVTAPVHRYWLPLMTATINGEWDRWVDYYIHTLYPFGRLARSTIMTLDKPEMVAEFMFGIPLHKFGRMMREDNE